MSAFFVATISVKDREKFADYASQAYETIKKFQGEPILRGKAEGALDGNVDHQIIGVSRFPDMETLNEWYESDEYQALIPLRDEAADIGIIKYEEIS
jgi:uncharacterized protein (DUF1330 family)